MGIHLLTTVSKGGRLWKPILVGDVRKSPRIETDGRMSRMLPGDLTMSMGSESIPISIQAEIEHAALDEATASGLFDMADEPGMERIPVTIHLPVTPELAAAIARTQAGPMMQQPAEDIAPPPRTRRRFARGGTPKLFASLKALWSEQDRTPHRPEQTELAQAGEEPPAEKRLGPEGSEGLSNSSVVASPAAASEAIGALYAANGTPAGSTPPTKATNSASLTSTAVSATGNGNALDAENVSAPITVHNVSYANSKTKFNQYEILPSGQNTIQSQPNTPDPTVTPILSAPPPPASSGGTFHNPLVFLPLLPLLLVPGIGEAEAAVGGALATAAAKKATALVGTIEPSLSEELSVLEARATGSGGISDEPLPSKGNEGSYNAKPEAGTASPDTGADSFGKALADEGYVVQRLGETANQSNPDLSVAGIGDVEVYSVQEGTNLSNVPTYIGSKGAQSNTIGVQGIQNYAEQATIADRVFGRIDSSSQNVQRIIFQNSDNTFTVFTRSGT